MTKRQNMTNADLFEPQSQNKNWFTTRKFCKSPNNLMTCFEWITYKNNLVQLRIYEDYREVPEHWKLLATYLNKLQWSWNKTVKGVFINIWQLWFSNERLNNIFKKKNLIVSRFQPILPLSHLQLHLQWYVFGCLTRIFRFDLISGK